MCGSRLYTASRQPKSGRISIREMKREMAIYGEVRLQGKLEIGIGKISGITLENMEQKESEM